VLPSGSGSDGSDRGSGGPSLLDYLLGK
jgi:hypothetical protein